MKQLTHKQHKFLEEYLSLCRSRERIKQPGEWGDELILYSSLVHIILYEGEYNFEDAEIINKWVTPLVKLNRK